GVTATYFGTGRTLWVRGSASSVDVSASSSDVESGVQSFDATVRGEGWGVSWVADQADGVLQLSHSPDATDTLLAVTARNGAGLSSTATVTALRLDGQAPASVNWSASASAAARAPTWTTYQLDWSGGSDTGS